MLPGRAAKGAGLGCGEQAVEGPGEHRSISGALRVLHPVTSQGLSSLSNEKYHFPNVSQQLLEVQRKGSLGWWGGGARRERRLSPKIQGRSVSS